MNQTLDGHSGKLYLIVVKPIVIIVYQKQLIFTEEIV